MVADWRSFVMLFVARLFTLRNIVWGFCKFSRDGLGHLQVFNLQSSPLDKNVVVA